MDGAVASNLGEECLVESQERRGNMAEVLIIAGYVLVLTGHILSHLL